MGCQVHSLLPLCSGMMHNLTFVSKEKQLLKTKPELASGTVVKKTDSETIAHFLAVLYVCSHNVT